MRIISRSEEETLKLGEAIGRLIKGGEVICLVGDLGAGKTTLVKGIAKGMGILEG
ncbi:MAG TPA: tRNA (adenosine(37)-N6)-threonylcarbamoyltransferase complex ATPase subunit type 1 TsaE, partial [Aquificaceae bacterium]|nr:tRNA (adenosine(37)-N6)-threonylcarbamoyltransferase complex ATPase subunit type 1 TsaE [Aquificaceae bacterium]